MGHWSPKGHKTPKTRLKKQNIRKVSKPRNHYTGKRNKGKPQKESEKPQQHQNNEDQNDDDDDDDTRDLSVPSHVRS